MTVNSMAFMQTAYRNLGINNAAANKALNRISSGFRINSAADDAAGLAVSEKMRSQIRGLDQAYSNSMQAISMIQTAEGHMESTHSMLQRMNELAVQASTGTLTPEQRGMISEEFKQLRDEINRVSASAEYNGIKLLDGSNSNFNFQVGANNSASDRISVSVNNMSAAGLGIQDLDISTEDGAMAAISSIQGAINFTSGERATLGATTKRLEHTVSNLGKTRDNLAAAESTIRDADIALEMMRYTQANIMTKASQAVLAQGMNLSQQTMLGLLMR